MPSRLFALYVSVRSNKSRFQGGKGIEGLGVAPHLVVRFDAADLLAENDTLILAAEAALREYASGEAWRKVRYDPAEFGWSAPKK